MTNGRADQGRIDPGAYALLLIAPVLMTSNMVAARWVEGEIPPVALAFWRWGLTFLILLPFVARGLWNRRAMLPAEWPTLLVLGGLGMGVCGAPVYLGAQTTTATNIGLIYSAAPILIVLFARLFWAEPVSARKAVGIGLCFLGVLVIVMRGDLQVLASLAFTRGDLWIMLATVGWALYSVLLRYRPSRLPLIERFAAITLAGVVCMVPFYALEMAVGQWASLDGRTVSTMLFLALVPSIGAYLAFGRLISVMGAQRTGLLMYLVPLYNAGLAYVLLGETPRLYHLAGVALILPGLYLAVRPAAR